MTIIVSIIIIMFIKPRSSHCQLSRLWPGLPTINCRRRSRDKSGVQGPDCNFPTNVECDYSTTTPRIPTNSVRVGSRFFSVLPRYSVEICGCPHARGRQCEVSGGRGLISCRFQSTLMCHFYIIQASMSSCLNHR